jgi:hypothetical protein
MNFKSDSYYIIFITTGQKSELNIFYKYSLDFGKNFIAFDY